MTACKTTVLSVAVQHAASVPPAIIHQSAGILLNSLCSEEYHSVSVDYGRRSFAERADVLAFQQKFKVPMAKEPSFLDAAAQEFRQKFMQEELDEFSDACAARDMKGAGDALVDLIYVVHGTALMMGLPWPLLWEEVQRRNMEKELAKHDGSNSKRGSPLDVVKPAGWIAPDHTAALEGARLSKVSAENEWPVFDATAAREQLAANWQADSSRVVRITEDVQLLGVSLVAEPVFEAARANLAELELRVTASAQPTSLHNIDVAQAAAEVALRREDGHHLPGRIEVKPAARPVPDSKES